MQFDRYPMAHRIHIERPYEPSYDTNIRRTFARERDRLQMDAFRREFPETATQCPPLALHGVTA